MTDDIVNVPKNRRCTDDQRVRILMHHAEALLFDDGESYATRRHIEDNLRMALNSIDLPSCPKCGQIVNRRSDDRKPRPGCEYCEHTEPGVADADAA